MIDPADSSLTQVPGAVTFTDPGRATNAAGERWTDAATARFVPTDPDDRDAYDRLYRWCFTRFPRFVWCDEAGIVLPAQGYPRGGNTYIVQGAKRRLGHIGCHTRPREVNRNLIAQAQFVGIFDLPNPDDRRHVAELTGVPPATLEAAMAQLGEHEFLWWNQRERRLLHLPALKR